MKLSCDVIKDILPLYAENIASRDSCIIVEEHIVNCKGCKEELEKLSHSNIIPIETDIEPLKKIKATLNRKKYLTILFSIMITLSISIVILGYLTTPRYIPYTEKVVGIENNNHNVIVKFSNEISGYDVEQYLADDGAGYIYHITAWNSIWNETILKKTVPSIVLNPNGEKVTAIYYNLVDGTEDILIYGNDPNMGRGVITLPRLFLTHYLIYAIICSIICSIGLMVWRRNKVIKNVIMQILFLPISYIVGHLLTKGLSMKSYSATHDLFIILLIMIPIYSAITIGSKLIKNLRVKRFHSY